MVKNKIDKIIRKVGGANVTSHLVCKELGVSYAQLKDALGMRFSRYIRTLEYEVFPADTARRMRPEDRKRQMIETAVLLKGGVTSISIAKELGISPSLVLHYFGSMANFRKEVECLRSKMH